MVALLLIIILYIASINAQTITWERTYGELGERDVGFFTIQTFDGGYIAVGNYFVKTDPYGNIMWERNYRPYSCYSGFLLTCCQSLDSGYTALGYTYCPGGTSGFMEVNTFLIKLNHNGDSLWVKRFMNTYTPSSILPTSDGGFIFTGTADLGWTEKMWVVKTDSLGNIMWRRFYGESLSAGYAMAFGHNGGYIVVGEIQRKCYIVRINSVGDTLWTRRYDYPLFGSIMPTSDICYVVVSHGSPFRIGLSKINDSGDTLWTREYDIGPGIDELGSVCEAPDGGYVAVGHTNSFGGDLDVLLVKTDSNGNLLWMRIYGDTLDDEGFSIRPTSDGGFIIAGYTTNYPGRADIYLIKTDSLGNVDWVREILQKPQSISLSVFPSPFNSSCVISAPSGSDVEIYDIDGRLIWSSPIYGASGNYPQRGDSSPRQIVWTPDESVKSGVYFVRATVGEQTMTKRLVLMR